MRSTWAGGVGRPWVPIREEAYKDLIYLNDAYKRAIIDSQGQEESSWDVENSLNVFFCGTDLVWPCAFGGQYDIQPLKIQKAEQSWEGGN